MLLWLPHFVFICNSTFLPVCSTMISLSLCFETLWPEFVWFSSLFDLFLLFSPPGSEGCCDSCVTVTESDFSSVCTGSIDTIHSNHGLQLNKTYTCLLKIYKCNKPPGTSKGTCPEHFLFLLCDHPYTIKYTVYFIV